MWQFNWGVFWAVLSALLAASEIVWMVAIVMPLNVTLTMADHNAIVGKLGSIESLLLEMLPSREDREILP
jgi:hypothetical protein